MDQDLGVGYEVRRLREAKGWSQTRLAAEADMSVGGVSLIENGHRNLTTVTLGKLAKALGVEVRDLFPLAQPPLELLMGRSVVERAELADAMANTVGLLSNKLRAELGTLSDADELFVLSLEASLAHIGARRVAERAGYVGVVGTASDAEDDVVALLRTALDELDETCEQIDQAVAATEAPEAPPESVAWISEERRRRAS